MTFREKSITKLYAFAMAAVFALVLAGCGGGGGTAQMPDPEPPVTEPPSPTPEEMEAEALEDAQNAAMAAATAAAAAVAGAVDPVAATNAKVHADAAQEASDAAAAATTSEMAEGHQTAAETARDSAVEAAGERGLGLTSLANKITNQSAIDNAVLEGREAPKAVSNATRVGTELAATAANAVEQTAVTSGEASPSAGSVSQGAPAASATVTHGASGPTITVTGPGGTLVGGEAPKLLTTRGDWMGRELLENAASDTYVNVYTDIQAPKTAPNYDATNTVALAAGQIIGGDIPGNGKTFTGTLNVSATDNVPMRTGRFFCASGTACSISVDEKSAIVATQGYVFQPMISGTTSTADADYLAWGVWLTVPDATGTNDVAAAGAFASGNDAFQVRAELTGTATYNGVASGMYSAAGMVEYFDADVSLTANFGGTLGADSTPGSAPDATDNDGLLVGAVTGSVSNIMAGGMSVDGSLTLKKANIIAAGENGDSTTGFDGDAEGTVGGALLKGEWGGQFYGPNKAAAGSMAARTEYPTTAAGTFGATGGGNTPVSILGSFGSWKAE
ncbi:MAG: hypothetical protein OXG62_15705 [Nitrospinae bacterium]|nr:hypothetical protein [Nitrospinota bacterium]